MIGNLVFEIDLLVIPAVKKIECYGFSFLEDDFLISGYVTINLPYQVVNTVINNSKYQKKAAFFNLLT